MDLRKGLDFDLEWKEYSHVTTTKQGGYTMAKIEQLELTVLDKAIH